MKEQSLLDWLQEETNSCCISDLRTDMGRPGIFDKLCEQVRLCPEEAYPLAEWQRAAEYLTRKPCPAASVAEVKAFICQAKKLPPKAVWAKGIQR